MSTPACASVCVCSHGGADLSQRDAGTVFVSNPVNSWSDEFHLVLRERQQLPCEQMFHDDPQVGPLDGRLAFRTETCGFLPGPKIVQHFFVLHSLDFRANVSYGISMCDATVGRTETFQDTDVRCHTRASISGDVLHLFVRFGSCSEKNKSKPKQPMPSARFEQVLHRRCARPLASPRVHSVFFVGRIVAFRTAALDLGLALGRGT